MELTFASLLKFLFSLLSCPFIELSHIIKAIHTLIWKLRHSFILRVLRLGRSIQLKKQLKHVESYA